MSSGFAKKSERTICSPLRRGAGGGARTRTVLPPRDFKSLASACFATPAYPPYRTTGGASLSRAGSAARGSEKCPRRRQITNTRLLHLHGYFDRIINYCIIIIDRFGFEAHSAYEIP